MTLFPDQDENFQGLTLEAPDTVFLTEIPSGYYIWEDASTPKENTYSGALDITGTFSVFVPEGEQEAIWRNLSDKINFVVMDLNTGEIQERRRVDGGWHIARQGISVTMDPRPADFDYDYSTMPSGVIHSESFHIEVFDNVPEMPKPDTVLELYVEYRGFRSDTVQVKVQLKPE